MTNLIKTLRVVLTSKVAYIYDSREINYDCRGFIRLTTDHEFDLSTTLHVIIIYYRSVLYKMPVVNLIKHFTIVIYDS